MDTDTNSGEWAVVMQVFGDGSAIVRVEEGQDIAMGAGQLPPAPQPGEAGRVFFRVGEDRQGKAIFRRATAAP